MFAKSAVIIHLCLEIAAFPIVMGMAFMEVALYEELLRSVALLNTNGHNRGDEASVRTIAETSEELMWLLQRAGAEHPSLSIISEE